LILRIGECENFSLFCAAAYGLLSHRAQDDHRFASGGLRVIDWERVKELRDAIGADDFAEVVTLFLEEADEVIARIAPALGSKALEADLHFLKGAALNLGFASFAALCQIGERRAAGGETGVDIESVRGCYQDSKAALQLGLAQSMAA
jgi:histidine phosphotransfer protein HptB